MLVVNSVFQSTSTALANEELAADELEDALALAEGDALEEEGALAAADGAELAAPLAGALLWLAQAQAPSATATQSDAAASAASNALRRPIEEPLSLHAVVMPSPFVQPPTSLVCRVFNNLVIE